MYNHYSKYKMEMYMLGAEFNLMLCDHGNKCSAFANIKTVLEVMFWHLLARSKVSARILFLSFSRGNKTGIFLLRLLYVKSSMRKSLTGVASEKISDPNPWKL